MHGNAGNATSTLGNEADQIAYTVKHAAQVLDIGERTLWALVQEGKVESFKIGWSRRIPRSALLAYVESLRSEESQ